jgi:hypothetical protein
VGGVRRPAPNHEAGFGGWVKPTNSQGFPSVGFTHPTTVKQGFWNRLSVPGALRPVEQGDQRVVIDGLGQMVIEAR